MSDVKPIFMFSWKPDLFDWSDYAEEMFVGSKLTWSTLSRQMKGGDRFILLRTGRSDPGIVAYGEIISEPYQTSEDNRFTSWWVPLRVHNCIESVNEKSLISRQALMDIFSTKSSAWAPQANGTRVREEFCPLLDDLLFKQNQEENSGTDTKWGNVKTKDAMRLVKQRIGQNVVREQLLKKIGACEISGISDPSHLRASHIIPWHLNQDVQGDLNNVLLLAIPYDHLFDRGFITFDNNGQIKIAKCVDEKTRTVFCLSNSLCLNFSKRDPSLVRRNLEWHRNHIFKG